MGVESAVGHGASFWFEIPERVAETVGHSLSDLPMENRRVLLVDDDDDVLDLLKGLLASSGYELVRAGSIAEATRAVAERRPNAVLLDIQLPDGNGFDLFRALILRDGPEPLPIVVLPDKDSLTHTLGNPLLIDWLIRPSDSKGFRRVLESALPRRHQSQSLRPDNFRRRCDSGQSQRTAQPNEFAVHKRQRRMACRKDARGAAFGYSPRHRCSTTKLSGPLQDAASGKDTTNSDRTLLGTRAAGRGSGQVDIGLLTPREQSLSD